MKRKQQDPREYSFQHTKARLRERYGVEDFSQEDYDHMCWKFSQGPRGGMYHFMAYEESDDQTIGSVNLSTPQGLISVTAVYHEGSGLVRTVLPKPCSRRLEA